MPLEVATHVKDLVKTNPAGSDPIAGSDDHIRLIKEVLVRCFPNLDGVVQSNAFNLNGFVPSGGIIAWSGLASAVPAGWLLCDGTNGTPNLHAKFLFGTVLDAENGEVGGNLSVATTEAGSHTHTINNAGAHAHGGGTGGTAITIAQMPSHNHGGIVGTGQVAGTGYYDLYDGGNGDSAQTNTGLAGGNQPHNHTIGFDGTHSHSMFANGTHNHSVDVLPPYYRLAYIMRAYPAA